jgi:LysR family transcriptional regulator, glycine cleavage system transcriptional activator
MTSVLPPLESLRVLAACVRHGSFSGAATELCLTPSAVSLRIRSLEARLGVKLFVRHGPKLVVTDQGLRLAEKVDEAMLMIQAELDRCTHTKRALRVTCAPTFASRWLVPNLARYHALPDSQPIALDATSALLPSNRFDVAIRSGTGPWRGYSTVELLPDLGTPMLSPTLLGDKVLLSATQLLDFPLLPDDRWAKWFELAGLPNARPSFSSTRFATYELEVIAALKGVGVALLSPFLFDDLRSQDALIAPFEATVTGPNSYWGLWREDAPAPHFIGWVQHELAHTRGRRTRLQDSSRGLDNQEPA